ncbi:MAG: hypothetical protein KDB01_04820 [Planctomycetaceae bacterium]|nr:hypothetical protein [Planctomycetaceae bacterium]
MTQLLVSVRSPIEAIAAVDGGADIVDVKEPQRGSLGCASPAMIQEIHSALNSHRVHPPLSVALGELPEWNAAPRDDIRQTIKATAPRFLKIGLAGTQSRNIPNLTAAAASFRHSATASWFDEWQQLRSEIAESSTWVAVAYADADQAGSPGIDDVLSAAITSNCSVLLIDTHAKDTRSLFAHLAGSELMAIRERTLHHGLKLALAGQITLANLPDVIRIEPDIIAVRGAVCDGGLRTASVSATLVQQFRAAFV